jgi:phenylpropionate dioxygenase-like ring-hydroxylating dioxygenase large terminal subunit
MPFDDYWYVVAESCELTPVRPLARRVLDEWLVCFRGEDGAPTVLRDRCLHRNAPLSAGIVRAGLLSCPYHGWRYDGEGRVVAIPSLTSGTLPAHCSPPYPVIEQDGFVYVRAEARRVARDRAVPDAALR